MKQTLKVALRQNNWFIFAFFSVSILRVWWHAIEFSHMYIFHASFWENLKRSLFGICFLWHLLFLYNAKKSKWNWSMLLEHCSTQKELLRRRRALKETIAIISVLWNMFKNKTYILAGLVVKCFLSSVNEVIVIQEAHELPFSAAVGPLMDLFI